MDLDFVNEEKCPCGKGIYRIEHYSDDWLRHEEKWIMDCSICINNYGLWTYGRSKDGMIEGHYLWVPIELLRKEKAINNSISNERESLITLATKRYLEKWLAYFKEFKTKKAIWNEIKRQDENYPHIFYPSLSTFYSHIKNKGVDNYLRNFFSIENFPLIFNKIRVEDIDIDKIIQDINALKLQENEINRQIREQGFI